MKMQLCLPMVCGIYMGLDLALLEVTLLTQVCLILLITLQCVKAKCQIILCADETACNFNEGPICEYPAEGVDCDGNCDDGGLLVTCDGGSSMQGEVA